jgi:hypothetical protein
MIAAPCGWNAEFRRDAGCTDGRDVVVETIVGLFGNPVLPYAVLRLLAMILLELVAEGIGLRARSLEQVRRSVLGSADHRRSCLALPLPATRPAYVERTVPRNRGESGSSRFRSAAA